MNQLNLWWSKRINQSMNQRKKQKKNQNTDGPTKYRNVSRHGSLFLIVVLVAVGIALIFYYKGPTVQPPSYKSGFIGSLEKGNVEVKEGFYGGAARGVGIADCSRMSQEGTELLSMFYGDSLESGSDDFRELQQLIGKLSCFKKDLLSPAHIVEATRKQNFATSHDIEPIAEITGRCFAKVIPPRDLELSFDKWISRGNTLLARLCTSFKKSDAEYETSKKLFESFIRDVKDIARGQCLQGTPMIASLPGPRDPHAFEHAELAVHGEYKGYY
jgi:hypothetical protein